MRYLAARGLSAAVIKHFGLGYSPSGFSALTAYLHRLGYTDEEMTAAFLCGKSKKTGRAVRLFPESDHVSYHRRVGKCDRFRRTRYG